MEGVFHIQYRSCIIKIIVIGWIISSCSFPGPTPQFESDWQFQHDRVWIGPEYWANPMEDWRIENGRLECISRDGNRNVHKLTHQLGTNNGSFEMSVRIGLLEEGESGSAGFRIGIHSDELNDYRANVLYGDGIDAGVDINGSILIGTQNKKLEYPKDHDLILKLQAKPQENKTSLLLTVINAETKKEIGELESLVRSDQLVSNIALVNNFSAEIKNGSRFAFSEWNFSGDRIEYHAKQTFGPILWSMHTLSNSRGEEGHVMKMTAFLPPVGNQDNKSVQLEVRENGNWALLGEQVIDSDSRTATFRIPDWPAEKDIPYRLVYTMYYKTGKNKEFYWTGTIRKDPVDRPLVIAGFTGNKDYIFPNREMIRNLKIHDPDVLFFSGDQIYENVGGYGHIAEPADRSILNYLRKWYLLGWSFGDLLRDRVSLSLPDDHDVFHSDLFGEGGTDCGHIRNHVSGGYAQPVKMINAVHRSQTSHHPDFYDPRPIKRGISVFYGDMVYGRISFAIIADRMFKSGPAGKVNDWEGLPDQCTDLNYDTRKLDKPGLKLLGDRQLKFLNHWAEDWRGSDMKIVVSQTIFCNLANYHGETQKFVYADLDANGWPQTGRNKAVDVMRRAFAFHMAGDQHLASLVHHGIDTHRDANWSLCVPSIASGYPRSWLPDKEGRTVSNRPEGGLPNTGDYYDGFKHPITVYAIGNPTLPYREGRIYTAHDKASGYGLVRMDQAKRKLTIECWRFSAHN